MVIFIVPAYNEEENLPTLLRHLRVEMERLGHPYHVVVVDDGSQDRTGDVARSFADEMSLEVIRHPKNQGIGAVFRTGFTRALERTGPHDVIVTKEADNTSDLSILKAMLNEIGAGADLVLASCFAPGGGVVGSSWDRHLLSFVANRLLQVLFPIPGVHTFSSFYRAYRAEPLRRAFAAYDGRLVECQGFACMVELLIKLSRLRLRIHEVPMILRCQLRQGKSKMPRLATLAEYLWLIGRQVSRSRIRDRQVRQTFEAESQAAMGQPC